MTRRRTTLLILAVHLLLISSVYSNHQLKIVSPKELADKFQDKHIQLHASAVGYTPRTSTIMGLLTIANPADACSEIQLQSHGQEWYLHHFVLANSQGDCPVSTKAKNIMQGDGYVAIIGSNTTKIIEKKSNKVNIPVMEISEQDLKTLTDYMTTHSDQQYLVKIEFGHQKKTTKVELDVWLSSSQIETYKNLTELRSFLVEQKADVEFKVGYVMGIKVTDGKPLEYVGCLSQGRYCAPERTLQGKLEGKTVIEEDLRQIIISRKHPEAWWDYIAYWHTQCLTMNDPFLKPVELKRCSYRCMIRAGIDPESIEVDFYSSFRGLNPAIDDNEYLLEQRQNYILERITQNPGYYVNKKLVANQSVDNIKKTVCQRMTPNYSDTCKKFSSKFSDPPSAAMTIGLTIVVLIVFMVGTMFVYRFLKRRKMQQDVQSEVSRIVQQYHSYSKTLNKKEDNEAL